MMKLRVVVTSMAILRFDCVFMMTFLADFISFFIFKVLCLRLRNYFTILVKVGSSTLFSNRGVLG